MIKNPANYVNTDSDSMSLGKNYAFKIIDVMPYNENTAYDSNTIDKTIEFLTNAKKKASEGGYVNVSVSAYFESERYDEVSYGYANIRVTGYVAETDKEYKTRLNNIKNGMLRSRENFERNKAYYDAGGDSARIGKIDEIVERLNTEMKFDI